MLSLCEQVCVNQDENNNHGQSRDKGECKVSDDFNGGVKEYTVICNTTANPQQPSVDKWTFLQARELAMCVTLQPNRRYLLIPRML